MNRRLKIVISILIGTVSPIFIGPLMGSCWTHMQPGEIWWKGPIEPFLDLRWLIPVSVIAGLPVLLYSVILTRLAMKYEVKGYARWVWYCDFSVLGSLLGGAIPILVMFLRSKFGQGPLFVEEDFPFLVLLVITGGICSLPFVWIWNRNNHPRGACFKKRTFLWTFAPVVMILCSGCNTPRGSSSGDSRSPGQEPAVSNKSQQLEQRVHEDSEAQAKSRQKQFRKQFEARMKLDLQAYSREEHHEIERLYQAANIKSDSMEKRENLKLLIGKYPKANRAGCSILYLGQVSEGQEREAYLRRAIDEFGDCWYGDGVQVGAYARFYLALYYQSTMERNTDAAEKLYEELRKDYPDAIDHQGCLLSSKIARLTEKRSQATNKTIEDPARQRSASGPSNVPVIRGTLRDGTQDYSEKRLKEFESAISRADLENLQDKTFPNALSQLMHPRGPLARVPVTLRSKPGKSKGHEVFLKTVTDVQGNFGFPDVPRGEYLVTAEIPQGLFAGTTEVHWRVDHYHTSENVALVWYSTPAIVKGKITDSAGRPLGSVKITATQCEPEIEGDFTVYSHMVSAISGQDGTYELRGLIPPNAWEAAAVMMGGSGYIRDNYDIHADVEGFVPAEVKLVVVPEDVRVAAQRLLRILLERGGSQGKARLAAMKPVALPACQGNSITGIDFTLGPASLIAGMVIDSRNKPQPDCYVCLIPEKDAPAPVARNAQLPKPVPTDGEGAFEFRNVPAGRYTFRIDKENRSIAVDATPVVIEEGKATTGLQLKFDAQPLGRIDATVCELETGNPINQYSVSVWEVVNPKEFCSAKGDFLRNAASPNQFSIEKISPGNTELEIKASGYVPEHLTLDVLPGQTAVLRVRMARAGAARIQAAQDGVAVPYLERLQAFSMESNSVSYGKNVEKEKGWYEIPDLKPGRYTIRGQIFNGQYSRYESAPVVIEAGKTSEVKLELGGGSGLKISLPFPEGSAAQAWVEDPGVQGDRRIDQNMGLRAYLYAKVPGDYTFEHLHPGTYRVGVRLVDVAKGQNVKDELLPERSQTVTLQEGKTAILQFHF